MSGQMTAEQAAALRRPFPPETIGQLPKGGVKLDYVGHAAVTDRLLQVDPAWTWEPLALTAEGLPALDRVGNLWIKLTCCGVTRIGVGDGKNAKEVISDAIRNAAMRFGVALDLWAKEDLAADHSSGAPSPPEGQDGVAVTAAPDQSASGGDGDSGALTPPAAADLSRDDTPLVTAHLGETARLTEVLLGMAPDIDKAQASIAAHYAKYGDGPVHQQWLQKCIIKLTPLPDEPETSEYGRKAAEAIAKRGEAA